MYKVATGVCRLFAPCKAKSSNQALLTDYCIRGHKIILRHLICQIRNALQFLDFTSWCKDSAIPSSPKSVQSHLLPVLNLCF